ncbi:MAG: hypothetical protein RIK87_08320 [Fuerstiella sp.]
MQKCPPNRTAVPPGQPLAEPDAESQAFAGVNQILRDDFALSVFQVHAMHEAIRMAGMDLRLRQK